MIQLTGRDRSRSVYQRRDLLTIISHADHLVLLNSSEIRAATRTHLYLADIITD